MKNVTTWVYSIKTDAKRILHCAHQMAVGFYKINNFIVLPNFQATNSSNIVIFPKIRYQDVPKFWHKVTKIDIYSTPFVIEEKLQNDFYNLISKNALQEPKYKHLVKKWKIAEHDVISTIYDLLPEKEGSIKKITIYPTKYGSSCSFSWINKTGEIEIWLRDDQGIHTIAEAIVTSLTRDDVYKKLDGTWQESEIITDFILTQTKLAKVLQKYEHQNIFVPTLRGTRVKDIGNILEISNNYYKELNIPNFDRPFSLNGLTPEINKKPILNLTNNEKQVMYLLIKNSNNTVSFDQISDIIFANENKFSLFALAKFIQRLREKLEKNGISGSFIQTLRGKGYFLKN